MPVKVLSIVLVILLCLIGIVCIVKYCAEQSRVEARLWLRDFWKTRSSFQAVADRALRIFDEESEKRSFDTLIIEQGETDREWVVQVKTPSGAESFSVSIDEAEASAFRSVREAIRTIYLDNPTGFSSIRVTNDEVTFLTSRETAIHYRRDWQTPKPLQEDAKYVVKRFSLHWSQSVVVYPD